MLPRPSVAGSIERPCRLALIPIGVIEPIAVFELRAGLVDLLALAFLWDGDAIFNHTLLSRGCFLPSANDAPRPRVRACGPKGPRKLYGSPLEATAALRSLCALLLSAFCYCDSAHEFEPLLPAALLGVGCNNL